MRDQNKTLPVALILRDGTTVRVRLCTPGDAPAMQDLLDRIEQRAGGDSALRERVAGRLSVEDLCDCGQPAERLTVLALRLVWIALAPASA